MCSGLAVYIPQVRMLKPVLERGLLWLSDTEAPGRAPLHPSPENHSKFLAMGG
jgi:hypothetical protein